MTLVGVYKRGQNPKRHIQYHTNLSPKSTIQQKTPYGDIDTKSSSGEGDDTIQREHDGHLPSIGEDQKTPYRDDSITLNKGEN